MSDPLPPDTRAVGTGNPAGDMDEVIDALTEMGETRTVRPSGDVTGVTDATLVNSLAAGMTNGGVILMEPAPAGAPYYWAAGTIVITNPGVYLQGAGQWATVVSGVGTGTLARMYSTAQYVPHSANMAGGGITGITFDGSSMGAGSVAVHAGDIYNLAVDFGARYFGGAGSIGAWLDNNYHWAEQLHGRIWCENNTANVVFDNSANTSGQATGSFDRMALDIYVNQNGLGNGVTFQNGANLIDGRLGIYGNFTGGGASKFYVLVLTGSNGAGYSLISNSVINIGCELDTLTSVVPGTINFASSANNVISNCTGVIDFAAADAFAAANNAQGSFEFGGPVYGDGFLQSSGPLGLRPFKFSGAGGGGNLANGDSITTRFSAIVEVTTGGNVTGIILQGFNPDNWRTLTLMNNGTGSVTFAAQATSNVAGGAANTVAASSDAVFTWNSDLSLWFMAGTPAPGAPAELALAPSGATAETFHRGLAQAYTSQANGYASGLVSGTVYVSALPMGGGVPVSNVTMVVGGTAFTLADVTHGWYALLDSGRVVRAVSADQTSGNWGTTFASVTLPVSAASYVTTYTGLYYIAFCATFTGTPGVFPAEVANVGGASGVAPILAGTSSTGLSTPPATGTTLAAITSAAGGRFYAYTS